jgi:RNA polymerase sigma-70 factor (ECF subfamily)
MDDAQLVRQAQAGQTSAYEVLVRRWSARLVGYIRSKVRHVQVAEDIAQDCLLKAFRSLPSLKKPDRFGSWLLSIGHHASLDWLKARSRLDVQLRDLNANVSDTESSMIAISKAPDARLDADEQRQTLLRAVDELPEPLREVLLIYYYDNVTYSEMATMLGISAATVNSRLTKARATLRDRLTPTWSTK